jgi:hypothetical protein
MAKGEALALAPAPARVDQATGAVKIPQQWDAKIRGALQEVARSDREEQQAEEEQQRAERAGA